MSIIVLIVILILALSFIFIYGRYVQSRGGVDKLQRNFATCPGCDYWALLHYLLFTLLAFLFPNHIFELVLLGIAWEILEHLTGDPNDRVIPFKQDKYWYGRFSDLIFNWLGLVTGYALSKIVK